MDEKTIRHLLEQVQAGQVNIDQAVDTLRRLPFTDLGFAHLDSHRALRTGFPEVVFCQGKTADQVSAIVARLAEHPGPVLATRATAEMADAVRRVVPEAVYHPEARMIVVERSPLPKRGGTVLVISAGTSDIPVAEEAALTAEVMGNRVARLFDVGVAGLHRLLAHVDLIMSARVLVVVAGMEGALPSVVGGLVRRPVIAVPTSVGYGASFNGLAALLGMLNSCASGVVVVNIDNGFGAGFAASLINQLDEESI
ncbi:MAG: nickel pincer cofactor biosynthesis protein LarB [Chloroflexi bacterium]|nr:MAG: nickel pincer cofactor biosynthesis protein LarB [Chloroflexota bacterium]